MMKKTMMLVAALSMFAVPAFAGNGDGSGNGSGLVTQDRVRLQTKDGTCDGSQARLQAKDGAKQQLRTQTKQAAKSGQMMRLGRGGK